MGINDYLKVLRRRWPVMVVTGLLGLLGYFIAPSAANPGSGHLSYSASATVLQEPDVKDPVESTALLVTSEAVAGRVSSTLKNHPAPQELLLQVTAVGDRTSNSIVITAGDLDPQAAVALAAGTVDEFRARHRRHRELPESES